MSTIRVLKPLSLPHYRRLFAAMALAIFGQGAWALYLAMQTLDLGATPAQLSGVVVWSGIGLLVCSLPAGVIADRVPKKSVLITVLIANMLMAAGTTWLAWSGAVTYWQLGISAFVIGGATAFFFPAYTALVPTLVDTDHLMAVNGLEGATRPLIGQAAAPALVGAVIGATVPPGGGLLIVVAFMVALTCVFGLPALAASDDDAARPHPLRDLAEGFGYVIKTRWIAVSVVFAAVMGVLVVGPLEVLLPAALRAAHDNGAAVYGGVLAALGVGGLVGSLVMGSMKTPRHFLPVMIVFWAVGCLPFAVVSLTLNPWILGAGLFVYGALIGAGMVIWGTVLQERVPLEYLGRVASLDFFVSVAFMPISIALVGGLSQAVGPDVLFLAAGVGPLVLAVPLVVTGALRTIPRTPGADLEDQEARVTEHSSP